MTGWIKLHRQLLDWKWYNDTNVKVVFIHLLLNAVWDKAGAYGYNLTRGQYITTRKRLANDLGLTEQQVRTALTKLKKTKEISINSTNKFMLITIVNYNIYQADVDVEQPTNNQPITNNQQTANQQSASKQPTNNQQLASLNKESKESDNITKYNANNVKSLDSSIFVDYDDDYLTENWFDIVQNS